MEVMVGSPYGVYIRGDRSSVLAQDKAVSAALFLANESRRGGSQIGIGLRMNSISKSPEESSDSSSSIGESSENDEEEDDAVSAQGGALDSLSSSLEDSLPIKRGLSNHYVGKSKSFGNLMEASNNAKNLEKVENPFNKRRRLLIANKLRSRERSLSVSNFHSWENRNSLPLLVLQEHGDDDYENKDGDQTLTLLERRTKKMIMMKNKKDLMAQTQSCFCLSSLQEEDDDDDGDDE